MNWGVQVLGFGHDSGAKCWRCLQEPVPEEDDHIGLCDGCLAVLSEPLSELPLSQLTDQPGATSRDVPRPRHTGTDQHR